MGMNTHRSQAFPRGQKKICRLVTAITLRISSVDLFAELGVAAFAIEVHTVRQTDGRRRRPTCNMFPLPR